jgi:hypothetical protein
VPGRLTPNDPRFVEQWQWDNTGQNGGTARADAVEVEQLLASPSTLELILGLNFLDPRADAWFSSEGRGAITVIVGRPGRARRPVLN